MKENLGLKKTKVIKSFSFDVNTPYEEEVIGAKVTGKKSLVQLPSFVGETLSYAQSYCSSHGIKVNVKGGNGYIISQSVPAVSSITLTAGGNTSSSTSSSSSSSGSSSSSTNSEKEDKEEPEVEVPKGPDELISGCTDSAAINFNPSATKDDGSCKYEEEEPTVTEEDS